MKQILFLLLFFSATVVEAQDSLSQARLKTLKGVVAPFSTIAKKDSLFLICFWATSSDESVQEMNAINAGLDNWKSSVPFRFLGVCVDEGKAANKLRPTYNMNSWTFDVFLDLYGDLRRALHSNNLPQSMIIYKNKIVYQQSGWSAGSDNYLYQKLLSIYRSNP
ncbi:MAG: hypothetical protein Q8918_02075 [Bacteroidota bacterium]|nr:hypothetical protein [Bacteroidota bacterium]MDP4212271.1 hypothetical protein [Bacteroidota bacterium]MDP4248878.1 hypothetical protein [Bacteroidota bacterium]